MTTPLFSVRKVWFFCASITVTLNNAIKLNNIFLMTPPTLSEFVFTRADRRDDTTVDEQVGAVDEGGMLTQQE